jgi:sulfate-transporting ATPase
MIAGKEKPDSGEVIIGSTVQAWPLSTRPRRAGQRQDRVGRRLRRAGHPQRRQIPDGQPGLPAGRFNFNGGDQQKRVGTLSGGERGRLHLAKTLIAGGNVLLLDEPSNDLDVETLRALEDALLEFAGS